MSDKTQLTAADLFLKMCELDAEIPCTYDPKIYSIRRLAELMGQTKYIVRKKMEMLEKAGLVCRTYEGGQDDDGNVGCYHGWSVTEKATKTMLYKNLKKEAIREFEAFMSDFRWEARNE